MQREPLSLVLDRLLGVKRGGKGFTAKCPAHEDDDPSLSVGVGDDGRVLVNCHGGCSFESIVAALGLSVSDMFVAPVSPRGSASRRTPPVRTPQAAPLAREAVGVPCPADVDRIWALAIKRAATSPPLPADVPLIDYIRRRGVEGAVALGLVGFLDDREALPPSLALWPRWACRLVALLFNQRDEAVTLQSRRLTRRTPKTLFPAGSHPRGCVFANARGRELLRGADQSSGRVVLGEGLTDFWSLSICFDGPVLSAPGTSFVVPAIGAWARGRDVVLALDNDEAGRDELDGARAAAMAHGARSVSHIEWPDGLKDACDVLATLGADRLRACVHAARGGSDGR